MPLYYTLKVNNTSGTVLPLVFQANLINPLMRNPSEYDLSVINYSIPNTDTAIFKFIDNNYTMSLSYNNTTVTAPLIYIQSGQSNVDRNVWEIQTLIRMLNTTINTLYGLINAIITLPTTEQPYFSYNEVTKLISYTANMNYFSSTMSTPIILYINVALFTMIRGLPVYRILTPNVYKLLVLDLKNNNLPSANYYTMTQQAPSFEAMSDFTGILLTTNLPIENEFTGLQVMSANNQSPTGFNAPNTILQDYTPSDLDISTYNNNIVYNAVTPYRQSSLTSNSPFYTILINVFSTYVDGSQKQIFIAPNGYAKIKIMFTLKSNNKYA